MEPFVTVAMPCLNEEGHIEHALHDVLEQDYPHDRLEVIVADGGSRDHTRDILHRIEAEDARVHVVENPGRIQAAGLNAAIRAAHGEIIVRMDVHADYAPDYVHKCVEVLERTGADNVGGAARPRAETRFQRALCAALGSPAGVGGSKYRSAENEGFVESVFNGTFRRQLFEEIGLYDEGAVVNEDAELNQRILEHGGRIYLSREIVAWYYPRGTLRGLARQYFRYGRGRARTLLKHHGLPALRPMIPFFMVTGAALLLAVPPLHPLVPWAFGAYAGGLTVEAVRVGRRVGAWAVPLIFAIFVALHVSHGVGFATGLGHYLRHHDWAAPRPLGPRPVG
jgi:cellulose synthase/poly-beta-1,6-N-acetylglucosamine synthase-like glycosyltransferase